MDLGGAMCFSAVASFSAAAVTGTVGLLTLSKAASLKELPLAAAPFVFSVQQALEGILWLTVGQNGAAPYTGLAVNMFLIIALIVWPVLVPAAAGLIESRNQRQMTIYAFLLPALGMAVYGAHDMVANHFAVQAVQHTLCYVNATPYPPIMMAGYILCTCAPLIISSDPILRLLGLIVGLGLAIAAGFFYLSFVSVWCFFAAAGSAVIYLYFYRRAATRFPLLTKAAS
jgi:hypothetical protein